MNHLDFPASKLYSVLDHQKVLAELNLPLGGEQMYEANAMEKKNSTELPRIYLQQNPYSLPKVAFAEGNQDVPYSSLLNEKLYEGLFGSFEKNLPTVSPTPNEKTLINGAATSKSMDAFSYVPETLFNFVLNLTDTASTTDTNVESLSNRFYEDPLYESKIITRNCNRVGPYKTFNCSRDEDLNDGQTTDYTALLLEPRNSLTSGSESLETDLSQNSKMNAMHTLSVFDIQEKAKTLVFPKSNTQGVKNFFLNVPSTNPGTLDSGKMTIVSTPSCPPGTPTYSMSSEDTTRHHDILRGIQSSPSYQRSGDIQSNQKINSLLNIDARSNDLTSLRRPVSPIEGENVDREDCTTSDPSHTELQSSILSQFNALNGSFDHTEGYRYSQHYTTGFSKPTLSYKTNANHWILERPESNEQIRSSVNSNTTSNFSNNKTSLTQQFLSGSELGNSHSLLPARADSAMVSAGNISINGKCIASDDKQRDPLNTLSSFRLFKKLTDFNLSLYASKRWQNLNVVLPIFVPHGVIAVIRSTGENTYVFSDEYPASQLLFSGSGRICNMWATYLRLRVAVIHKCPEFLVPRVAQVFNQKLANLPKFGTPIRLRCSGIVKHTIRLRSSEGLTYRYDTIGQFYDAEDKKKMGIIFDALQTILTEINTKLTKEVEEITKVIQYQELLKSENVQSRTGSVFSEINDLRASILDISPANEMVYFQDIYNRRNTTNPCTREGVLLPNSDSALQQKCGLEFRFSPCKELKIPIREGSVCECGGADCMIAGGGASSMSSWAQQFSVDDLILGEIRLERDKTSETQLDPFFLPEYEIRTRMISKDFDKEPARVCFVDSSVYPHLYRPEVKYSLNTSPLETAKELCGATHEVLAQQLPKGLASLIPNSSYYNTVLPKDYLRGHINQASEMFQTPLHSTASPGSQQYIPNQNSENLFLYERMASVPYTTLSCTTPCERYPYPRNSFYQMVPEPTHSGGTENHSYHSENGINSLSRTLHKPNRKSFEDLDSCIKDKMLDCHTGEAVRNGSNLIVLENFFRNVTPKAEDGNRIEDKSQHLVTNHEGRELCNLICYSDGTSPYSKGLSEISDQNITDSCNLRKANTCHMEGSNPIGEWWYHDESSKMETLKQDPKISRNSFSEHTRKEGLNSISTTKNEAIESVFRYLPDAIPEIKLYNSQGDFKSDTNNHISSQESSHYEYTENALLCGLNRASSQLEKKNNSNVIASHNSTTCNSPQRTSKSVGGTPAHRRKLVDVPKFDLTESMGTKCHDAGQVYLFYQCSETEENRNNVADGVKEPAFASTTTTGGDSSTSESVSSLRIMVMHSSGE